MDIERDTLPTLTHHEFDALCFIHVLEHLVDPVATIQKLLPNLKIGGKVIIAVPNIANWRERWKLALGRFEYTDGGVMDKTHLHFYTFHTGYRYLVQPITELKLEHYAVNGNVPLACLRHQLLTPKIRHNLDSFGCYIMPNLFGGEILIKAIKWS